MYLFFSPGESLALSEFEFGAMVELYHTRPEADTTLLIALKHVQNITYRYDLLTTHYQRIYRILYILLRTDSTPPPCRLKGTVARDFCF